VENVSIGLRGNFSAMVGDSRQPMWLGSDLCRPRCVWMREYKNIRCSKSFYALVYVGSGWKIFWVASDINRISWLIDANVVHSHVGWEW
jgi:hypothetical protein